MLGIYLEFEICDLWFSLLGHCTLGLGHFTNMFLLYHIPPARARWGGRHLALKQKNPARAHRGGKLGGGKNIDFIKAHFYTPNVGDKTSTYDIRHISPTKDNLPVEKSSYYARTLLSLRRQNCIKNGWRHWMVGIWYFRSITASQSVGKMEIYFTTIIFPNT